jgi:OOP family OmpA-OmpF porin
MIMNTRVSIIAFGLLACSAPAHAEDSGAYVGFGVGEASNKVGEFDDSSTLYKAFGGYAFNQYFAAELAYVDAGVQRDRIGDLELSNEASGVIASAILRLPLTQGFALYGKIGHAFYDAKATARLGNLRETETESENDLTYGFGVELAVWRGLRVRAEYEIVDVNEGDYEMVSASAVYKF